MAHNLLHTLMRLGPSSSQELAAAMGISQPTVSRLISENLRHIVRVGGSKNTLYAAMRYVRQLTEATIPVFRIDETGKAHLHGNLHTVHPEGYIWAPVEKSWPLEARAKPYFQSLPYFIHDMRHQGFMGRHFAKANCAFLGVPEDPAHWSDDDVLVALSLMGADLPGNLIVGEASYQRFAKEAYEAIPEREMSAHYLSIASREAIGECSALVGGELSKLTSSIAVGDGTEHVIVKFSGDSNTAASRRSSDLLRSEAIALVVVEDLLHIQAAIAGCAFLEGRAFLLVDRFDRVGLKGRRSMCSLASVDAEFLGMGNPDWDKAADKLYAMRLIDKATQSAMRILWYFGKMIGNTDMHSGNISFEMADNGKLQLCPVYDMLPMRYAPHRNGEVPELTPVPLFITTPGYEAELTKAREAALVFWREVQVDEAISEDFNAIAIKQVALLS